MSVKTYDPAQVELVLGPIRAEGYADGTFIEVARDNPSFNSIVGSDGEGARSKSNDRSATITVTLMQTSLTNDAFSEIMRQDELTGINVLPLFITDLLGTTIAQAETAWLEKPADMEFAREITNREWVIKTTRLDVLVGGSPSI